MPIVRSTIDRSVWKYQAIASRLVKEIARLDGNIDSFVSPAVAERVRAKVKGLG